ncbi:hypothetical protein [Leptospira alexanderi]|uniref:hypothetical protein n=1 Tax=Leptospira alexanderi TaxID=100053 RepID=UPI00148131C0|nr:hypothetical protein [Leptospira alexanderi]
MGRFLSTLALTLLLLTPLHNCVTVPQSPDSVGMPTVLRDEAKTQRTKGEAKLATLLSAAADSIEAGDKSIRAATKVIRNVQDENSSLQREAGWGDGLQDLGWFIIAIVVGIILILVLYLVAKGQIKIPFIPVPK